MWCLYTIDFYSSTKKRGILLFAGKWMELEIILSEVRFRRPKAACLLSYVEYKYSNTMKNWSC
jgi:hypothetical protein